MTQKLIEHIERMLYQDLGDIKSDLRSIIEQHKQEETTLEARGYLSYYFTTIIRRHDFRDYIKTSLDGDFACVMSSHLRVKQAEIEQSKSQRDRLLEMLKTIDMKYAFGDCEPVQELIAEIEEIK